MSVLTTRRAMTNNDVATAGKKNPAAARRRPARPPVREIRPGQREEAWSLASSALGVLAIVCAWMLVQMLALGNLVEDRSQQLLYSQFRAELAQQTAPTGAFDYNQQPVAPGAPVALLTIPALQLHAVVVDGTTSTVLLHGPGHLRGTPLPGQAGISVVMGRAATYGAPFKRIASLRPGDEIQVLNATGRVSYTVADVRHTGDPIPTAPVGAKAGRLTLVSASGSGFLSALRPRSAVYVDAVTSHATPTGVVAGGSSPAEQPLGRDANGLPTLVLLLGALAALVYTVSVLRLRQRLRSSLVWTMATPVAIALAWAVTNHVMALLPNLM